MKIKEYTLNNNNITLKFLNLGGIITHFSSHKDNQNIVLRFQDLDTYYVNRGFLGATVGPLAGRTENATFKIEGQTYNLDQNTPPHHLHGGQYGLSKQEFNIKEISDTHAVLENTFDYTSSGYPGSLHTTIRYTLMDDSFTIETTATPTHTMPINITNHSYFNLDGSTSIKDHYLTAISDRVIFVSENGSNTTNIHEVKDTIFDLNTKVQLNTILSQSHPQFEMTRHIDHTYCSNQNSHVILESHDQSKKLRIDFDTPAFQIYLANFFDGSLISEDGTSIDRNRAIAIEPQNIPNEINLWGKQLYSPSNPFTSKISYTLI